MSVSTFRNGAALAVVMALAACEQPSILLTVTRPSATSENPFLGFCKAINDCRESRESGAIESDRVFPDGETERTFGLFGGDGPLWIKFRLGALDGPCVPTPTDGSVDKIHVTLSEAGVPTATCAPSDCDDPVVTCQ